MDLEISASVPSITQFDPSIIPYQKEVLRLVRRDFDYSQGTLEVLLSGAVGSAKTLLMAHLGVTHCLMNPRAKVLLGRKSLPDLKATIYTRVKEHLEHDLVEGKDYKANDSTGKILFKNGSLMFARSWADKKYRKFRSYDISAALLEELTENNEEDAAAYHEIKMRLGRLNHIKENFIIAATNPDSPRHWVYNYFIRKQSASRRVFYSRTRDNTFLPVSYVKQLETDLDPKMALRMLEGQWIEISEERLYYAYDSDRQFRKDKSYTINPLLPIWVCWDFNIGEGKPLSLCLYQRTGDVYHVFADIVIHGARTLDSCDELASRGFLNKKYRYKLSGDATGKARSTKSLHSDWEIIEKFFSNYQGGLNYETCVPNSNPPIRTRHNLLNAQCQNVSGDIRLYVYKDAPVVDEGLRLTALKKGGSYIEDDSKEYQHVTTALGYGVVYDSQNRDSNLRIHSAPR